MTVPPAATPAPAEGEGFAGTHIRYNFIAFRVPDQRAPRNPDNQVLTVLAEFPLALAVRAVVRHIFALVTEIHQGRHIVVNLQNNGPAPAAVASVRTARRHVLFPMEGYRAVASVSGPYGNAGFIYKC